MSSSVPAVELFTTSILSNHKVRHRHERYIAVFTAKKIDYVYHDLASDEDAKKRFRRKAKDPQIPNILVHNEWRGTFEEFEESVEFGELDLFLSIDPNRVAPAAAAAEETTILEATATSPSTSTSSVKLPPAPHAAPKMAPVGTGAGPRRSSMDEFLDSINDSQQELDSMSEADLSSLLEEGESQKAKASHEAAVKAPQSKQLYPGEVPLRLPSGPVKRTYFPSEEAGTRALRLPKMGNNASPISRSASTPHQVSSTTSSPGTSSSGHAARYSVSQNSSRALAAEANASTSSRVFSARQVRAGLDSGKKLQEVLEDYNPRRTTSSTTNTTSTEIDSLLEDLGLGDLNLTSEEAESFLLDGTVPEGMELGGHRLQKGKASKARETQAARDVASQARDLADARRASAASVRQRQASEQEERIAGGHGKEASIPVPEVSDKTKALLDKVREKRASRLQLEALGAQVRHDEVDHADTTTILHTDEEEDAEDESQKQMEVKEEGQKAESDTTADEAQAAEAETETQPELPAEAQPEAEAQAEAQSEAEAELQAEDPTPSIVKEDAEKDLREEEISPSIPDSIQRSSTSESAQPETDPVDIEDTTETPRPASPAIKEAKDVLPESESTAAARQDDEEIDDLLARLSGAEHLINDGDVDQKEEKENDGPKEAKVDSDQKEAKADNDQKEAKADNDEKEEKTETDIALVSSPPAPSAADTLTSPQLSALPTAPATSSSSSSKRLPRPPRSDHPPVSHSSRRAMDIPRKMSDHNLSSSYQHDPSSSSSSSSSTTTTFPPHPMSPPPADPKSPKLRRKSSKLRPSFGSLGRKSKDKSSISVEVPSPPLPSKNRRGERTLSQILRDADAALAEADGPDGPQEEEDEEGKKLEALKRISTISAFDGIEYEDDDQLDKEHLRI
ncbi:unnamed protein product [Sympodiomycopsis kandeliae]